MGKKPRVRDRGRFEVITGQGRRFSFSAFRQAVVFYVLLLLAFVIIVQLGYHWLGEQFLAWRLQVVQVEAGFMENDKRVDGFITREEEVIRAPVPGIILELFQPGERVPAGAAVARLGAVSPGDLRAYREALSREEGDENGDSESADYRPDVITYGQVITVVSERAGLLSYHFDGWEEHVGPLYSELENGSGDVPDMFFVSEGDLVDRGEPVAKIVNNWSWFYSVVVPLHSGRALSAYRHIVIDFDFSPGKKIEARLYEADIDEVKMEVRLSYLIDQDLDGFDQNRRCEATLLYNRRRGIIVPAKAVTEKDSVSGVYINRGGRVVFQPVDLVRQQGEEVMVQGLDERSLVISRPDLVEEGRRLY